MGGIRVEQEPTVVGLGWNLNAGGVITRQMKGRPDNEHNGWLHNGYYLMNKYLKNLFTPIGKSNFLDAAAKSEIDTEPDEYTVITPHFSFKFTYDSVKNIIQTSPFAHYDIKYDSIVDCWTVKADNGFSYYFSETELTEPDLGDFPGVFPIISYVSSWYISSIRNDNGDIVLFEYENYEKTSSTKSETDYLRVSINTGTCTDLPAQTGWASTKVYGKALSRISYENSCLEFFRNSALLSDEGRLIYIAKREDGCNLAPTIRYNFVYDGVFLKEIQTQSSTCFQPPYIFEYLPCSFLHQKQDHWGFANENLNAGTTLLPEIRTRDITLNSIVLPGAYRGTDKNKVKQGSLYKITYPTGGHTMFDMEVNTVENNDIMRPDFSSEMCDFDDVSVFASLHNSATGIYSDSLTFSITEKQCVWIKGNARIIRTTADPAILSVQCDTFPMQSCSVEMPNTTCTINLDETYVLSPGTYTISVNGEYGKVDVDIKVYIKNDPFKMNVGGLRVKRITHHDGVNTANDKIFRYEYDYLNTSGEVRPSGNLTMMPKYGYSFIYLCEEIISISGPGTIVVPYIYFARSSSSLQSIRPSNPIFPTNKNCLQRKLQFK
jgi:hypothetical protein